MYPTEPATPVTCLASHCYDKTKLSARAGLRLRCKSARLRGLSADLFRLVPIPNCEYTATSPSSYLLGVSGYRRVGLALATLACVVPNAVQVPPPVPPRAAEAPPSRCCATWPAGVESQPESLRCRHIGVAVSRTKCTVRPRILPEEPAEKV